MDAGGSRVGGRARGAVGGLEKWVVREGVDSKLVPPRPGVGRRRLDLHVLGFLLRSRWFQVASRPAVGMPAELACNKTRNASLISIVDFFHSNYKY